MKAFESESIDMCMTSPPFWGLRDYGIAGQIGLESTSEEYVQKLIAYFHELKRILKITGSFYLNLGDTYMKKNLQMIPARVALALQKDGWILRNDVIWYKPNHMPSSVKDRLTNTYEHLFHFVKSKKYYYDLDSIRIPHKTGPASFNYRVREAKRSSIEIVGVKASYQEMKEYDSRGQRIRGLKIKGNAGLGQEQYHGQDVSYHPKGSNPGNIFYETKFDETCQAKRLSRSLAYARRILGGEHETALNHPLGKNPGDVITTANTGINNRQPYKQNNPHRLRLEGNEDCTHPLGKNPGDVFCQEQHPKYVGVLRQGKRLPPQKDRPQAFHPCGKNPGDVLKTEQYLDNIPKGGKHWKYGGINSPEGRERYKEISGHPLGGNPGDVVEASLKDINRHHGSGPPNLRHGEAILSSPRGKNLGDVFALNHAKLRGQSGEARTNLYQPDRIKYHELGKNPGDIVIPCWKAELARTNRPLHPPDGVSLGGGNLGLRSRVLNGSTKYKGRTELRQDDNLGGKVGLARFRDSRRANGMPEGHFLGKNPGDVIDISPDTRSKNKLLSQRRRDLADMRAEGRIHWELHPAKNPAWFNPKGKSPTDFWEIRPKPFLGAHFAVYPEALCIRPIISSCPPDGIVLDPFVGSGTTMKVALELGMNAIGIELNPKYIEIIKKRVPIVMMLKMR
jgi:DNA modification methylase